MCVHVCVCTDASLSDNQGACHHSDGLAELSVVTFLLFSSQLFCSLVIAFLYKMPRHGKSASNA